MAHLDNSWHLCAANPLMGTMQAEGFTRDTGMNWRVFKEATKR